LAIEQTRTKLSKENKIKIESERTRLTDLGTTCYSLFFANTIYYAVFLILAFYFLKEFESVNVRYILSVSAGSLGSTLLSYKSKKERLNE
jgi:hypothetical protein